MTRINKHIGVGMASLFLAAGTLFTGCDSFSGTADTPPMTETQTSQVTVKFGMAPSAAKTLASAAKSGASSATSDTLIISGTNGTLVITDLRMLVEEFELEREDAACESTEEEQDGCEGFEAGPSFVDVPLDSRAVQVAADALPLGTYTEFEFKVEDLDLQEEEDDTEKANLQSLIDEVRAVYADWPNDASMVVVGSFTPSGGSEQPFKVYLEAEIEVEMAFNPPLAITSEGASESLNVQLNPEAWFLSADGNVLDLSAYDYETTDKLLKFELELEKGFSSLEVEEDEDEDDEREKEDND